MHRNQKIFSVFIVLAILLPVQTVLAADAHGGAGGSATMTHRMMFLVLQLGILLFATKLGNILFERLKLPGVLGELSAGIVIGPFLLGAVPLPGFPEGLFPVFAEFPVSPELYGFCSVAAVLLLFMVGLETNLKMFLRYSIAGSAVGLGGVLASFILGDLTGVWFGSIVFGKSLGFWHPSCLFLGVISTATSVGITARVLAEKRKLDSPEGVTILAGAVIDDVLGIVLLAVVLGLATATESGGGVAWSRIGLLAAKAILVWLAATAVGLIIAHRIGGLLKKFGGRTSIAVMSLGLALILAGLFEEAGLAMIIGAYVMGLSLSQTDLTHVIREKLETVFTFLVPIFFGVMGMLVNIRALADSRILLFGLIYAIVAVLAKIFGAGLPCLLFKFNLRGALRVGTGMVPRGEVALIIAGVGLAAGVLPADVFGVAVLMTILTTVAAPPILVFLFKNSKPGVVQVEQVEELESIRIPCADPRQAEWLLQGLMTTLRHDGFFVHLLQHEHQSVLALRDKMSISFYRSENDIVFSCDPHELPVVRAAVMDVVYDLHVTAEALRKPLDIIPALRDAGAASASLIKPGSSLELGNHIRPEMITLKLKNNDKNAIIHELLDLICANVPVADPETVYAALLAREESMSTGLEHGVAVPHCRTDAVKNLTCAIGITPRGVEFNSLDGEPAKIILLTLSPVSVQTPHVQFMSRLAQTLTQENVDKLLSATSRQMVFQIITGTQTRKEG